jgi:ATP/maltotriose-dependent transcriptional regulator MalT
MESAGAAGFANSAHNMALDLALTESMLGGPLKIPAEATQPATGNHTLLAAGRLYALNGDEKRATALADSMLKQSPSATYVSRVWAPAIQAEVEIHRGNAARAIELLQPAGPYEYGSKAENLPAYVRGRAYLRAGRGSEAAAEFQKVLDHQGTCLFGPLANVICAVSRLELARARALAGDSAAARTAYQDFLARWKDADADVPLLAQARQELARLK